VATRLKCGGIFNGDFIVNLLLSLVVKEFWKSVSICGSYRQVYCAVCKCFLCHSVYIVWQTIVHAGRVTHEPM